MLANGLISEAIPPLSYFDTIQKVLDRMDEFRVSHLPVLDDGTYLGVVSDDDLIEIADYSLTIKDADLKFSHVFINQYQHIYDVIKVFSESHLSVLSVLDENRSFLGVISINTIIEHLSKIAAIKEPGGIIVLEMNSKNSSLGHIAQIIESENTQILSSYITSYTDSTRTEITIKVNRTDISSILASLGRYDYNILATYNNIKEDSGATDRYDQLMNYLSI